MARGQGEVTLGTAVLAFGFIIGTMAIAFGCYFGMRWVAARAIKDDTRELAGSVIFRVSALHGLILALVFAQEMLRYQDLQSALVDEATAVADIYNDSQRYGAELQAFVQPAMSTYARIVVEQEWTSLALYHQLSSEGWRQREDVYQTLLDLVPQNPREEALREHMIERIQVIATLRQQRENMALFTMSELFWVAAFAGIILVAIPYFVFAPTVLNLVLLGVYGAFNGIVMLIIFAFSDPFAPPGALDPTAFIRLLETDIGQS